MRQKKKNTMRTPDEKEKIVLEALSGNTTLVAQKYQLERRLLNKWKEKYRTKGIDGLKSMTGKNGSGNHLLGLARKKNKTIEEELKIENLKLKIEVARLKKGYLVKGVGTEKEFVTIKDSNMKF